MAPQPEGCVLDKAVQTASRILNFDAIARQMALWGTLRAAAFTPEERAPLEAFLAARPPEPAPKVVITGWCTSSLTLVRRAGPLVSVRTHCTARCSLPLLVGRCPQL
jgi:hypothetical protein